MEDKRDIFIQRLTEDLLGPLKKDEILKVSPENTYLNGILSPSDAHEPDEQDDETDPIVQNSDDTHDEIKDRISNNKIRRPSSMGLSFCLDPRKNKKLQLEIKINLGIYKPELKENSDEDKKKDRESIHSISLKDKLIPAVYLWRYSDQ